MSESTTRLLEVFARIDAVNAADPNHGPDGQPEELAYGRRMTAWLAKLYPDAAEPLQIAARAQHIKRWEIPRSSYPMDRAGYHRWRTTLYSFHADQAAKILRDLDYDEAIVSRVGALLRKERLKADADAQALEDVACLVFLEFEFAEFAARQDAEKMIRILRRTWAKMSARGHAAALALPLPVAAKALVARALAPEA